MWPRALRTIPADAPLVALRDKNLPAQPLTSSEVVPGFRFDLDPKMGISGTWHSPRGRLLELETQMTEAGDWFALHLALPNPQVVMGAFFGFVIRTSAAEAIVSRVCLRSGMPEGRFQDQFFNRHVLSQAGESDHHDMIDPARCPDIPQNALWREFILFLPPTRGINWVLHDLRLIVL